MTSADPDTILVNIIGAGVIHPRADGEWAFRDERGLILLNLTDAEREHLHHLDAEAALVTDLAGCPTCGGNDHEVVFGRSQCTDPWHLAKPVPLDELAPPPLDVPPSPRTIADALNDDGVDPEAFAAALNEFLPPSPAEEV